SPQLVACEPACALSITNQNGSLNLPAPEAQERFRIRGTVHYQGPNLSYDSVLNIIYKGANPDNASSTIPSSIYTAYSGAGALAFTAGSRTAPGSPNTDFHYSINQPG